MSGPLYNLSDRSEPITIGFTPLSVPLVAHFVGWNDTEHFVEAKPVLGVLVRHVVNGAGEVTEDRVDLAIQLEDSSEICTPMQYVLYCGRSSLLGIWAPDRLPSDEEIQHAVRLGRHFEALPEQRRAA